MSNVPKLRFKEFDGEWHKGKLNKYLSFNNGINAPKEAYGYGRKFINVLDILNNDFILYKNIIGAVSVSPKIEEANKVEYGDVLFLRSSETREDVGKSTVYLEEKEYALFGGFVIRGKNKGNYNPYFLKLNLESPKTRYQIGSKAGGSTRFNVSQSVLNSIEVKMPGLAEQQKVADYFLLMEKKIKNQQRKIELLKEQKKGYMQKIFNRELRFKDENGKEFTEWKSVKLKDLVIKRIKGKKSIIVEKGNVLLENDYMENGVESRYVEEPNNVTKYDLLILWDGSQAGKVYTGYEGVLGSTFVSLRFENETISNYIYYLLKQEVEIIQRKWREGSGVPHVSKDFVEMFLLELPSSGEQGKIVSFFKELERKIKLEEGLLLNLKKEKKAYMQQMFV